MWWQGDGLWHCFNHIQLDFGVQFATPFGSSWSNSMMQQMLVADMPLRFETDEAIELISSPMMSMGN